MYIMCVCIHSLKSGLIVPFKYTVCYFVHCWVLPEGPPVHVCMYVCITRVFLIKLKPPELPQIADNVFTKVCKKMCM